MDDISPIASPFFTLTDAESAWGGEADEGGCWPTPLQKISLANRISLETFPCPRGATSFCGLEQ